MKIAPHALTFAVAALALSACTAEAASSSSQSPAPVEVTASSTPAPSPTETAATADGGGGTIEHVDVSGPAAGTVDILDFQGSPWRIDTTFEWAGEWHAGGTHGLVREYNATLTLTNTADFENSFDFLLTGTFPEIVFGPAYENVDRDPEISNNMCGPYATDWTGVGTFGSAAAEREAPERQYCAALVTVTYDDLVKEWGWSTLFPEEAVTITLTGAEMPFSVGDPTTVPTPEELDYVNALDTVGVSPMTIFLGGIGGTAESAPLWCNTGIHRMVYTEVAVPTCDPAPADEPGFE